MAPTQWSGYTPCAITETTKVINEFLTGATAYFFTRKKAISNAAISRMFTALRKDAVGRDLFRRERVVHGAVRYSAIAFPKERVPTFLRDDTAVRDRVHVFILVVERDDFVAVLKSGVEIPSEFKKDHLGRLPAARVERAIATANAIFEQISVRSMGTSRAALRTKTLEADDLANVMSMSSASRYLPRRFAVRRDGARFAATPSTGRISKRLTGLNLDAVIAWTITVFDALAAGGEIAPFLANFARPVDLQDLPATVFPTALVLEVALLREMLVGDDAVIRLVTGKGAATRALSDPEREAALSALDQPFSVKANKEIFEIWNEPENELIGEITLSKSGISISKLKLADIKDVDVERLDEPLGQDKHRRTLRSFISREKHFLVSFSDVALAYADGQLYRDPGMAGGGARFMAHLREDPVLTEVTTEKGEYDPPTRTAFDEDSAFGRLVTDIAAEEEILICDDLGNEWADFIGLTTTTAPPSISFYHAKAGDLSIGASPFHEAVGQAEKNLGNLEFPERDVPGKLSGWSKNYKNDGVQTAIARIVRGGPRANVKAAIANLRIAPEVSKRVFIVTSSLSRKAVQEQFDLIAANKRPSVYFVQLYWLLNAYFDACAEVGAVGYVVCQP